MAGHKTVQYSALAVHDTDSDTSSDSQYINRNNNQQSDNEGESIKLQRLQPDNKIRNKEQQQTDRQRVKVAQPKAKRDICLCFCVFVLILTLTVGLVLFGLHDLLKFLKDDHQLYPKTSSWTNTYKDFITKAYRVVDIDDDGRSDVVVFIHRPLEIKDLQTDETAEKFCRRYGMTRPCYGAVVGLRGYDGKELWRTYIDSIVFEIVCQGIDINGDGKDDCLLAGRISTMTAVNPVNGKILWHVERKGLEKSWNIFAPAILPDVDNDNVPDLLMAHGGDPSYAPEDHDRRSGRLFLISGAHGTIIGHRYYSIPESKETYMPPVLHHWADGTPVILFGSGGETVPGSLYAITVANFYRYVFNMSRDHPVPTSIKAENSYPQWEKLTPDDDGVYEIYRAQLKGIIVPPVLVEMNKDGVPDILVSTFDGVMLLLDGKTLDVMWNVNFPGHESYNTPAPGYFNDDDVLDFTSHWNHGAWKNYSSSKAVVIDGKNGSVIWSLETATFAMASDLVARSTRPLLDTFVLQVRGRTRNHDNIKRKKRHFGNTDNEYHHRPVCRDDLIAAKSLEVFLVTRLNTQQMVLVADGTAKKYYYNVTSETIRKRHGDEGDEEVESGPADNETFCAILEPNEGVTGGLCDLDGDGSLDIVLPFGSHAPILNKSGHYVRMKFFAKIVKINLSDLISNPRWISVKAKTDIEDRHNELQEIKLRPTSQPWTGYLGNGNSVYQKT